MSKKSWYVLRIVAGLYLTYLGINLIRGVVADKPENQMFMLFMAGIFIIVGVLYAASSIKKVWAMRNETVADEQDLEEMEDDTAENDFPKEDEASGNSISEIAEDNGMNHHSEDQDTDEK